MSHHARKGFAAVAAAAALSLVAAGCAAQSSDDDDTPEGGATAAERELAAVPGFDPAAGVIRIGDILALSGPISATAKEQLVGQQIWFDKVNEQGGIAGKYKIELITEDNQYNPQLTVQAYQKIADEVVMLSGVLGSPSVKALIPLLDRTDALAVPSAQDPSFAKDPAVLPTFPSYQTNVTNAVSYLVSQDEKFKTARYCQLVMDSDWGIAVSEGVAWVTGKIGAPTGTIQKFAALDTAFTAQITALKNDNCEVVVFGGAANNLPSVVAAATQLDFQPQWIAEFIALATAFKTSDIAPYLTENMIFTGPGAKLDDESVEGIRNLLAGLGDTEITVQHVYGYMQAVATTTLLEKAVELGDLSGPGLRRAATELDSISFQGLGGDVTLGEPEERVLPRATTIYHYNPAAPSGLEAAAVGYQAPEGFDDHF